MHFRSPSRQTKLYFSVFVADLVFFSCGCVFGWTSPTILKLQSPDSFHYITDAESSWIVSLVPGGAIIGPVLSGVLLDSIGRKANILIPLLLFLLSWTLLAVAAADNIPYVLLMCVARLTAGFGIGISFSVVPVYIAEIAEDSVRSAVNTIMQFFFTSGILLQYCAGPYISYLQLIIVSITPCIFGIMLYPWLRESPYYLVYKNDTSKAISNLQWLRGGVPQSNIEQEIKNIQETISEKRGSIKDIFITPVCRRVLLITCGLFLWQQLSGIGILVFYTEPIFKLSGVSISTSVSTIIFGTVNVIMGAVSPPIINHFGYKRMLIISAVSMIVTHGVMGIFLFLTAQNYSMHGFRWLPIVALVGYVIGNGIGFANIPWAINGELFPTHIKAVGTAASACFCSAVAFLLSNLFPDLVNTLGLEFVFGLFSLSCACAVLFIVFKVPDTNGMSLAEVQELLNSMS